MKKYLFLRERVSCGGWSKQKKKANSKKLNATLFLYSAILVFGCLTGCVNYPETYTYSPTVTVNSSSNGSQLPVVLPNPFATNKSNADYSVEGVSSYPPDQPSPLTAHIPYPPVSAHFYYDTDEKHYARADFEQPIEELVLEAY